MPKISIIVPLYNVEKYLEKSLTSFVNQTMDDIEIIIVDDGSPDESYKIYNRFAEKDQRIKIIKKENAGVSEARNTGLDNATGEFIIFADPDDWMEPNCCEILYNEQKRTQADLVVADVIVVKDGNQEQFNIFNESFTTSDPYFIKQYQKTCIGYSFNPKPPAKWRTPGIGSPWNKLFIRSIIQKYGLRFDPYVKGIYDDNLFTLHYLMHIGKLAYIQKPVYNFQIVSSSITKSYKPNTLDINRRIFTRINDFIDETQESAFFEEAFYVYVNRRLAETVQIYFFSEKNPKSRKEKYVEYSNTISSEPYHKAIQKVHLSRLNNKHKLVCIAARLRSPFIMDSLVKLKNTLNM